MINNPEIRIAQYVDALRFFIEKSDLKRIVIVENTNTIWLTDQLIELATNRGVTVEFLAFQGDQELGVKHSIGYSHMEMVYHAFYKSKILERGESLLVMDGRYKIFNIRKIMKHLRNGECVFIPEVHRLKKNGLCDMRLYMVNADIYINFFWSRRFELSPERLGWVESLYDRVLRDRQFSFGKFVSLPRCVGVQGSTGVKWDGSKFFIFYFKSFFVSLLGLLRY